MPYFDCTTGRAAPVVDTVLAVIYGAALASALGESASSSSSSSASVTTTAVTGGALALVFAASAATGYSKTGDCRDAKEELAQRLYKQPQIGDDRGPAPDPWLAPSGGGFGVQPAPPPYQPPVPPPGPAPVPPNAPAPPSAPPSSAAPPLAPMGPPTPPAPSPAP
jgi:hypothetical protein